MTIEVVGKIYMIAYMAVMFFLDTRKTVIPGWCKPAEKRPKRKKYANEFGR